MSLDLVIRLWCKPGRRNDFRHFEDRAVQIMADHGGQLVRIDHPSGDEAPDEVHHLTFPDISAFDAYRTDPRLKAMTDLRARVIRKTEIDGLPQGA